MPSIGSNRLRLAVAAWALLAFGAPPPAAAQISVSEVELRASRELATREAGREAREDILSRMRLRKVDSYTFTLRGPTDEDVIHQAKVRALVNTASRLYFDNFILLGRPILEPYAGQMADRFIAQWSVKNRRILADNSVEATVKVGVHVDRFYEDLNRMNFIDQPKLRPTVAVLLNETIDGAPLAPARGRPALEEALTFNSELRIESQRMNRWGLNVDAGRESDLLFDTLMEAQRWGIDVVVTGALELTLGAPQVILFDQRHFIEGSVDLQLLRVDTGQTLRRASRRYSATGASRDEAIDALLKVMMPRVVADLTLVNDRDIQLTRPLVNAIHRAARELRAMDEALADRPDREVDSATARALADRLESAARGRAPVAADLMDETVAVLQSMKGDLPNDAAGLREKADAALFDFRGLLPLNFLTEWGNTVLDRTDYRLMISGASSETIRAIANALQAIAPSVRVHVKSQFGDVSVLNVVFPDAAPGQVERFLRESRTPQFRVLPVDGRRFELTVL
jgi:hypothetical protein